MTAKLGESADERGEGVGAEPIAQMLEVFGRHGVVFPPPPGDVTA